MEIELFNCNSIDHGLVSIQPGLLNIKYGINGTGKSSFARAIESAFDQTKLDQLTPYKYLAEDPIAEDHRPKVNCPESMKRVAVFNDTYVDQYLFQADEVMPNSFEILIKTADYDQKMEAIQRELEAVQKTFRDDPELDTLIRELTSFTTSFGKAQNGYSSTGSLGKGVAKGNRIEHIPPELVDYTPFIRSNDNIKWLSWQSKGKAYLGEGDLCPYCAGQLPKERRQAAVRVQEEYDTKYVTELQKMLDLFKALRNYFSDDVNREIDAMAASAAKLTKDQIEYLKMIKSQVESLCSQLQLIHELSYKTLKDVKKMADKLKNLKINLQYKTYINTPYTQKKIQALNDAIDLVLASTDTLQEAIGKQTGNIRSTIRAHEGSINGFLKRAGYSYQIAIEPDFTGESYKLVLKSIDSTAVITDAKAHLSYGERNAFALVLFMYQALREDPDLIIVDDPISSFDQNKKYAIMEMLFQSDNSFQGRTVIMLTHDFEPVLDVVHTFKRRYAKSVRAAFLYNQDGELREKEILHSDIMSFNTIADRYISSNINDISKMIYLRRKLEALGDKGNGWQLLSSIVHSKNPPTVQTSSGETEMTEDQFKEACAQISEYIPSFSYDDVTATIRNFPEMMGLYRNAASNYEKVQLFRTIIMHFSVPPKTTASKLERVLYTKAKAVFSKDLVFKKFIDGAYHIENDSLFQLDPAEYPTIPDYIIALCDRHLHDLEVAVGTQHSK